MPKIMDDEEYQIFLAERIAMVPAEISEFYKNAFKDLQKNLTDKCMDVREQERLQLCRDSQLLFQSDSEKEFIKSQKSLDADIISAVNENFHDLLA